MPVALLHPGDLGLLGLLELLLLIFGVPALVVLALAYAVYKGVSGRKNSLTTISLEANSDTDERGGARPGRA